ncbi:ATP-dependent nuclease [Clavibacter michiganensis]|uniref:ATP-dependent nuclease n=1 Tax=Clavibacter michiganensis TaxID=28447 RepID=UPI00142E290F|nr:AAA family ATPase [Clavibacter michiganensis subsp. michiganensis]QXP03169.1 ATP-dependent endonuclease [Clavibacter michiganensis subsp. michiganensis]QXP06199.1 ATP-dependent endonuclease [Clavibacter michiganensis subsp. michiganensis]
MTIRNYRSLKDVTLHLDDYGAFIGANGSGKSSVLYALDWFFNATPLAAIDLHGYKEGGDLESGATIEVTVTFADLTNKDRERLQQYGRGESAEIRRTWYADTKQTKTVGNAKQGPGFTEVRTESQAISARRQAYRDLRETITDLPELPGNASKDAMTEALSDWESNPAHASQLVEIADSDANQMMGWNGANVLRECVRFVLIPAATSIAGEVGMSSRGTALTELVGAFMAAASARAQAAWLKKHADAVNELSGDIRTSIEAATGFQAGRINTRLASLIPNARVTLTPTVPEFVPKLDSSISTEVTIGGITNDVSRQGHGVQRAVMISMFQVMVPDEDLTRETHAAHEGEDEAMTHARLEDSLSALPSIVVAIEEPEIYQHPVRARAFARTLLELSNQPNVQMLLATHSPYFIQPEQFDALHRFTYTNGETSVETASVASVANESGLEKESVQKAIISHVPTEFSEGFFADGVVLVEGQTDRIVLEAVATKLGKDLDRLGVTVLSVEGKGGLRVARAILVALGVPTYVLADGDFGTSARKNYKDLTEKQVAAKRATAHGSHKADTDRLIAALPTNSTAAVGTLPYTFGQDSIVCGDFTIWKDDIEEELGAWGSFDAALSAAGITLASRTNKNLLAYRKAVFAADDNDLPEILKGVISQIVALGVQDVAEESKIMTDTQLAVR